MNEKALNVVFFLRKPFKGYYSLELLFDVIINNLAKNIDCKSITLPFYSKGIWWRVLNIVYTMFNQGSINHITGDIHYVAFFLKKRRTILTVHDLDILFRSKGLKYQLIKLFWFTLPLKRVSVVTTISQATKNDLLKIIKFSPERIIVIPNCLINPLEYKPKFELGEKPILLQIGTKENKNIDRLIKAIQDLHVKLIIVGELSTAQLALLCNYRIDYENYYGLTNPELSNLYYRIDILAFVSTIEGFGLPIIEAQSAGRVVITSNISSMPEVAGEGALLVNPYDVSEIRKGIEDLMNNHDLRVQLIQSGIRNVKKFEPEHVAELYFQLYKKLLKN